MDNRVSSRPTDCPECGHSAIIEEVSTYTEEVGWERVVATIYCETEGCSYSPSRRV